VARDEAASAASAANEQAAKLLNAIFFDFDSSTLSQPSRDTLSNNAAVLLKKQTGLKIQVEGHCDERGSAEYNLALGERRAKSAMNYLLTLGVPASRLSVISYGKEKPADQGHDDAAWAKNRRAEFVAAK
jgi:peptidoglycan-associated lipoprotein